MIQHVIPVHTYNPVQIHKTTYKYITNLNTVQARRCEGKHSLKSQTSRKTSGTLGCYAREHWARKTTRREVEEGP